MGIHNLVPIRMVLFRVVCFFPGVAGHHLADAKQSHWAFRAVIIIPRSERIKKPPGGPFEFDKKPLERGEGLVPRRIEALGARLSTGRSPP